MARARPPKPPHPADDDSLDDTQDDGLIHRDDPQGDAPPDRNSRAQNKREMAAVLALAERLVKLPANVLGRIPLSEEVLAELEAARRFTARTARQRQIRHLSKILRDEDLEPIVAVLGQLTTRKPLADPNLVAHIEKHREGLEEERPPLAELPQVDLLTAQVDAWHKRLLNEGDAALSALIADHPTADRARLRQLMRAVQKNPRTNAIGRLRAAVHELLAPTVGVNSKR